MILDISLSEALTHLGPYYIAFGERIYPNEFPIASNSPYRPGYDWLFLFERKLARLLDQWIEKYRWDLIGEKGLISEALSNAYCHGNSRNKRMPIDVYVYVGENGLIVHIEDSGSGFNVERVLNDYWKKRVYFNQGGNGIRLMMDSKIFGAFYDKGGCAFCLMYVFDEEIQNYTHKRLSNLKQNTISKTKRLSKDCTGK